MQQGGTMIDTKWIREKASQFPKTLWLSPGMRGQTIRRVEDAIGLAALALSLESPRAVLRSLRLHLASHIYGREITTFNDLADAEMWALSHWLFQRKAEGLEDWLRQHYGETTSMTGG